MHDLHCKDAYEIYNEVNDEIGWGNHYMCEVLIL